jgi:hypothetical protein
MRKVASAALAAAFVAGGLLATATPAQAVWWKDCSTWTLSDVGFGQCRGSSIENGKYIEWRIKVDCAWASDVTSDWYRLNSTNRQVSANCGGATARSAATEFRFV